MQDPWILINLSYDKPNDLVSITFLLENEKVFDVKIESLQFDKFCSDMVKLNKEINLEQAKEYQKRLDNATSTQEKS